MGQLAERLSERRLAEIATWAGGLPYTAVDQCGALRSLTTELARGKVYIAEMVDEVRRLRAENEKLRGATEGQS